MSELVRRLTVLLWVLLVCGLLAAGWTHFSAREPSASSPAHAPDPSKNSEAKG